MLTSLLLFALPAQADTWNIDPSHTQVGFRVSHMMISTVEGSFPEVSGSLELVPGRLSDAAVEVEVTLASVDTGNDQRDEHLRTSDFLDVANHPTMRFVSKKVVPNKKGGFDMQGELTLRGVTKPVTLHAKGLEQAVVDPWGNTRVGAHATGTIDRQAFGVSWNQALEAGGLLVGDEVELEIDVEFVRAAGPAVD